MFHKKRVVILGSTGSLGAQALSLVQRFSQHFSVYGVTGGNNVEKLQKQVQSSDVKHALLEKRDGLKALCDLVEDPHTDIVIHAMGGVAGLLPLWSAVRAGKTVLLANKESIVCAGSFIVKESAKTGAYIIPLDSELSALRNCLRGMAPEMVKELILTCSGGPFWGKSQNVIQHAIKENVLRHPTWRMGERISVDSATMMNKGFEVIETHVLFDVPMERIRVLIHPQSVVHGMVTFTTGETRAVLAPPDMKMPILAALTEVIGEPLLYDFPPLPTYPLLQFHDVQNVLCPPITLARKAAAQGGTLPAVLCAADETAVEAFLSDHIKFSAIVPMVEDACTKHMANGFVAAPSFETILKTIYDYRCYSGSWEKHPSTPRQTDDSDRRPTTARTHV